MATHQIGNFYPEYADKRRTGAGADSDTHVSGGYIFTANAAGTTTTIVGANAAPATPTNVVRIGEKIRLFNSSDVLKAETVHRVTAVAVAGSTTVTFTPAAAVATASGDKAALVSINDYMDMESMDRRLAALNYTAAQIASMTYNDKVYAMRVSGDASSL